MRRIFSWAVAVWLCVLITALGAVGVYDAAMAPAGADTYAAACSPSYCSTPPTGTDACAVAVIDSLIVYPPATYGPKCFQYCGTAQPQNGVAAIQFGGTCPATSPSRNGYSNWIGCSGYFGMIPGQGCIDPKPRPHCWICTAAGPVVADPIGALTGQLTDRSVDYESAGPFPLRFTRDYITLPRFSFFSQSMFSVGHFAAAGVWQSNFEAQLYITGSPALTYPVSFYVSLPGNRQFVFYSVNYN